MTRSHQTVAVGSTNPVKIEAVTQAFQKVWPDELWSVSAHPVDSGIAAQPMSDRESIQGAVNRARAAQLAAGSRFGVGLEGGIQQINDLWFDCGWIAVIDDRGTIGLGSTARIITPPKMIERIRQGKELGTVVDELFGTSNAKQKEGHMGLMTDNAISRTSVYSDGVITALSRFLHPELFD